MELYRSSSNVYWHCKYHIVWTPKYLFMNSGNKNLEGAEIFIFYAEQKIARF